MSQHSLLCDDEPHILRAAEYKLQRSGYSVNTACDGQDAWEQMQACRPDLVVNDCQMPRLDGLELVRRMRGQEEFANVPVLMLSGKGFELSEEELHNVLGIRKLLAKPFSPRGLLALIEEILAEEGGNSPLANLAEVELLR